MTIAPADFAYVRELVHRRSAIALEAGKEYLVETRLLPIARASGEGSLDRLVSRLRSSPEGALHQQVVEAMTTNETSWFRDRHPYESLESVILPDLLPRRAVERKLVIWSAAAATGQEAYSIAMVLHERLAADPTWNLRVLATDLSEEMVRRTRAGRYSQLEINRGLPAAKLVRHFTRAGTEWLVNEPLRRMVEARQLNLAAPFPPLPPVDVLFLRNVLIYFRLDTRRQILDRVRRVLRPDGYLVLGGAETNLNGHGRRVVHRSDAPRRGCQHGLVRIRWPPVDRQHLAGPDGVRPPTPPRPVVGTLLAGSAELERAYAAGAWRSVRSLRTHGVRYRSVTDGGPR